MAAPPSSPKVKALECPNCGSAVELRTFGQALSAVCPSCYSVMDTKSPSLEIISRFHKSVRVEPAIPLGRRGKLGEDQYEVAGFQDRFIVVEEVEYHWQEYLLFSPYKGFRYLVHYNGHWNDVKPIKDVPEETFAGGRKAVSWNGQLYRHFQTATARTGFVLGEFPWRVTANDTVVAEDFTAAPGAPRSLSSEATEGEITWSAGEYIPGSKVWEGFGLEGTAPDPVGTYFNEPSPHVQAAADRWRTFRYLALAAIAVALAASFLMPETEAFSREYTYQPGGTNEAAFVTPIFELKGRTTNVRVRTVTDLSNQWIYINYSLIDDKSGAARDFGRMISYYGGDGDPADGTLLGRVPSGRYSLRVAPEWQPDPGTTYGPMTPLPRPVKYKVIVERDVSILWPLFPILLLLLVPAAWKSLQKAAFEGSRWTESDYGN